MLNFDEFVTDIKSAVEKRYEQDNTEVTVGIQSISKNNDVTLTGLLIHEKDEYIVPNIYLEKFYDEYVNGSDFDSIVSEIIEVHNSNKASDDMRELVKSINDYEKVKNSIVTRVVNAERNAELLAQVPHKEILDLAVTYHILVEAIGDGIGSIRVTNGLLNEWGVTLNELDKTARKNDKRLRNYQVQDMVDFLKKMLTDRGMPQELADSYCKKNISPDAYSLKLIFTEDKTFGASVILHKEFFRKIANECGMDLYVIPSSVHEILVLPIDGKKESWEYRELIEEVNRNEVDEQDYLSNTLYMYSKATKEITIAD